MICDYGSLEERRLEIRREDDGQYFDFEFPPQIFKTKVFKDSQELNRELIRVGIKNYFRRGRVFLRDDYKCSTGSRTVFRCKHRECCARLLYHKTLKQPILQVITFKNLHNHKKSKDPEKAKRQQINQFIMNLSGKDYEDFRNVKKWMEKFDLSNREALYIVEQLYWVNNTENQILTRLSYEGRTVRRMLDEGQTMLIYLRTDNMLYNYQVYGETITFQLSYDVLRKPSPFGNKYAVGFFYAQDQNLRLVLLSACLIAKESVKNFKQVFSFFLDSICTDKPPLCFITDEIKTLTVALRELRQERKLGYYHLFSWYHVIQNVKPLLKQLKNGRNVLETMCSAMQEFNEDRYHQHLKQLQIMLKGHEQIYKDFVCKQGYYSVRRMAQKFQGLALSTTFGNSVMTRTRNCTAYRVHTGRLFYKLIEIEMQLQKDLNKVATINTGTLKHYSGEINFFQDKLETKIMELLVRNYSDSKDCRREQINPLAFMVFDRQANSFSVTFSIQFDHWECECKHLPLIGLPCCHLIAVLHEPSIQGSLLYYVNTRWVHTKQDIIRQPTGPFITNKRRRP